MSTRLNFTLAVSLIALFLVACSASPAAAPTTAPTAEPVTVAPTAVQPTTSPTAPPVSSTAPPPSTTPSQTPSPYPSFTPFPTRASACPGAPPIKISVGITAMVSTDPPFPNSVRAEPRKAAKLLGDIQPGETMAILEGPMCGDNYTWWRVRAETGLEGWTSEGTQKTYWLVTLTPVPSATRVIPTDTATRVVPTDTPSPAPIEPTPTETTDPNFGVWVQTTQRKDVLQMRYELTKWRTEFNQSTSFPYDKFYHTAIEGCLLTYRGIIGGIGTPPGWTIKGSQKQLGQALYHISEWHADGVGLSSIDYQDGHYDADGGFTLEVGTSDPNQCQQDAEVVLATLSRR